MRVHTDASRGEEVIGIGYVIHNGRVITGKRHFQGEYTSMEAEHMALVEGLRVASGESRAGVDVYLDCEPLVGKMLSQDAQSERWHHRRETVHWLLSKFDNWSLDWIPREHNREANRLAQEAFWSGQQKI